MGDGEGAELGGYRVEAVIAPDGEVVRDVVVCGGAVEGEGYWAASYVGLGENGLAVRGPVGDAAAGAVEEDREAGTGDVVMQFRGAHFEMQCRGWTGFSQPTDVGENQVV